MKQQANRKLSWIILGIILVIFLGLGVLGGVRYREHQKAKQLYQHGFRLYEEQIATYVKENYSGVQKIEFSPIFIRRGGMQNAHIVPVIYDEYGNRELLGNPGKIRNIGISNYGLHHGLELDRDGATNGEIIELLISPGHEIEVQGYDKLPDKAKLLKDEGLDNNVAALVKRGYLQGVEKDSKGSPSAKVAYNLDIKEGDYTKWH